MKYLPLFVLIALFSGNVFAQTSPLCSNGQTGRVWDQRNDVDDCTDDDGTTEHLSIHVDNTGLFNSSNMALLESLSSPYTTTWLETIIYRVDQLNGSEVPQNILCSNTITSSSDSCILHTDDLKTYGIWWGDHTFYCADFDPCSNFTYYVRFNLYGAELPIIGGDDTLIAHAQGSLYPQRNNMTWSFQPPQFYTSSYLPNQVTVLRSELSESGQTCGASYTPIDAILDLRSVMFTDEWLEENSGIINPAPGLENVYSIRLMKKSEDQEETIYPRNSGWSTVDFLPYFVAVPLCNGQEYRLYVRIGTQRVIVGGVLTEVIDDVTYYQDFTFDTFQCDGELSQTACRMILYLSGEVSEDGADEIGSGCIFPFAFLGYNTRKDRLCYNDPLRMWPPWDFVWDGAENFIVFMWPKWPSAYLEPGDPVFSLTNPSTWIPNFVAFTKFLAFLLLEYALLYALVFYVFNYLIYGGNHDLLPLDSPVLVALVFIIVVAFLFFQIDPASLFKLGWL